MAAPVAAKIAIQVAQSKTGRRIIGILLAMILALIGAPFLLIGSVIMMAGATAEAACQSETAGAGYTAEQLQNVQTIATAGEKLGVSERGILIAISVGLVETGLRNLANPNVAGSEDLPHEGTGSDHDSVGLFQQRPSAGWGSVQELMTPSYAVRAFFGGASGPNRGSPAGLLDIPGWEEMSLGEAAQAVQVSAYPDRYAERAAEAELLLKSGGVSCTTGTGGELVGDKAFPVAKGTHAGTYPGHHGVDFPLPQGSPIYAIADGTVTYAGREALGARVIFIRHAGNIMTQYAHMHDGATGVRVKTGDQVTAGQQIGEVGSSGMSDGAHLHFEIEQDVPAGTTQLFNSTTAPYRWLKANQIAPGPLHAGCGNCGGPELVDDFAYSGAFTR